MRSHSEITNDLQSFAGRIQKVQIYRQTPCASSLNGFVLATSDQWLLLWQFHDFYPDGMTAIRLDGITDYRSGKYEDFWTKMLQRENIVDELPKVELDLSSTRNILAGLQKRDQNFIVECEEADENVEDFYLGRAVSIHDTEIKFASFDGLGKWVDALQTIEIDEISRFQFDTPYANSFSRHTDGPCPFEIEFAE